MGFPPRRPWQRVGFPPRRPATTQSAVDSDAQANLELMQVGAAYETLIDKDKREIYDQMGDEGVRQHAAGRRSRAWPTAVRRSEQVGG